jgi:hypothetical protein
MKGHEMEWWGYSKEHGWVVLDRSIPSNRPGIKEDLTFFRCKDSTSFLEKRERWIPPLYRFAPNYIRELAASEALEATAELDAFKAVWPDLKQELEREKREIEKRAEALRIEEEKKRKQAAREKKKQDAAAAH